MWLSALRVADDTECYVLKMDHSTFQRIYPWLMTLPLTMLDKLDYSEFFVPSDELLAILREIDVKHNVNIIVYSQKVVDSNPKDAVQLCKIIESDAVTKKAIEEVMRVEEEYAKLDVKMVAY
jgi:hypothetical protein